MKRHQVIIIIVLQCLIASYSNAQSFIEPNSCQKFLLRDLFKKTKIPSDQRWDDIVYLKLTKKQFDNTLTTQSYNGYRNYESYYQALYETADISCLAIGETLETMIVLDFEEKADSAWNLPSLNDQVDEIIMEFSNELRLNIQPEKFSINFLRRRICGSTITPANAVRTPKLQSLSATNSIAKELSKLAKKANSKKKKR